MTDPSTPDPTPAELDTGRDALRELAVEPLPADVLARLEGRLEAEPGLRAPPRRVSRRRPRLAFALPGLAVALAATVAIVVVADRGSNGPPEHAAALAPLTQTPSALAPKASAGAGVAKERTDSVAAAVRVPGVVGRAPDAATALLRARGLRPIVVGACATPVTRQVPRAGARVTAGSRVRLSCSPGS